MCHLDPGGHAEAIGDPVARAPARQGPYPERKKATRYSTKLRRYVKSTPVRPPATTTHDEPASVTYMRT